MDVLIVGGGVGGLAAAHGLLASGHDVRVLERAAGPVRGGGAVTLVSNGLAAAAALGVPLDELGRVVRELHFVTAGGRRLFRLDLGPLRRSTGHGVATVPRDSNVGRLAASLPPDVVEHGVNVVSVEVDPASGRAVVIDDAGATYQPDVVVGADGIRSTVRTACPGLRPAVGTGWAVLRLRRCGGGDR